MQDQRAVLVYGDGGNGPEWFLDMAGTAEGGRIAELFGTTYLPLPISGQRSRAEALKFAQGTEMGRTYGVRD